MPTYGFTVTFSVVIIAQSLDIAADEAYDKPLAFWDRAPILIHVKEPMEVVDFEKALIEINRKYPGVFGLEDFTLIKKKGAP